MEAITPGSQAVAVFVTCPRSGDTLCNTSCGGPTPPDLRLLASKGRPAHAKKCQLLLQPEGDGIFSISVAGFWLSSSGPLLAVPGTSKPELFHIRFERNGAGRQPAICGLRPPPSRQVL